MWELFPSKVKYGISSIASIALFWLFNQILGVSLPQSLSYTLTAITLLAFVVGKYVWKFVYCQYFQKNFCPNFNGTWICKVQSNFNQKTEVEFPITFEADFFSIKMKATTTIGNTHSNYCRVIRNADDSFQLEYMFQGQNHSPTSTDTVYYEGAASLRVEDVKTMKMRGVFWTNRCWQNNLNTAGSIELRKQ